MNPSSRWRWWPAALIVLLLLTLVVEHERVGAGFKGLLRWIDFLAPKPGLSGLFLLGLLPFGFVLLCVVVEWFLTRRARSSNPESQI